jgi:hypothetical protein
MRSEKPPRPQEQKESTLQKKLQKYFLFPLIKCNSRKFHYYVLNIFIYFLGKGK